MIDDGRHDEEDFFQMENADSVYSTVRKSTTDDVLKMKKAIAATRLQEEEKRIRKRKLAVELAIEAKRKKIQEQKEKKRFL